MNKYFFIGTGKTTTLIKMCEENPHLKFLVVVYNTTTAEHGRNVFPCNRNPRNVNCSTAHSLAYKAVGKRFKEAKRCDNLKASDVVYSGIMTPNVKGLGKGSNWVRAAQVVKTLESFMNSDDEEISIQHVPTHWETIGDIPLWQRFVFSKT